MTVKKNISIVFMSVLTLGLTACVSSSSPAISPPATHHVVKSKTYIVEKKLADGSVVKLAMLKPLPSWHCRELAMQSYSWQQLRNEGRFRSVNRGYDVLWDKAINYANEKHLKTNFIFYKIPYVTQLFTVGQVSENYPDNVNVIYYQCEKVSL